MSLVYLGTSEFAASVLRRLGQSGDHAPALVVTPPDRRRGRGRRLSPPPAAAAARELGIELLQTESVNRADALERIRAADPAVGVVCAFGQLIREPLLSELELLNVHPSLLPRWRGAAPIERAIDAGDHETGVTIMRVTAGLDSGPIALQRRIALGEDDFGALSEKLERLSGELVVEALDLHRTARLKLAEQDESKATYAEKIAPEERRLDLERSASQLVRRVRALTPHIGAYLELAGGDRLGVLEAGAESGDVAPGTVSVDEGLRIGCGDGVLCLERVQAPGGKPMAAADYLRGHPAPVPANPTDRNRARGAGVDPDSSP